MTNDDLKGFRFSAQEYAALMELFMVSDPWPTAQADHDRIKRMLNEEARDRGYTDWVDAYHEFQGGRDD